MYKRIFAVLTFLMVSVISNLLQAQPAKTVGAEVQVHTNGLIYSLRGGIEVAPQQEVSVRVGYYTDIQDDTDNHLKEKTLGYGAGLGYRYYTDDKLGGFFAGVRTDVWFREVEWRGLERICGTAPPCGDRKITGDTDLIMLQPSLEVGYNLFGGRSSFMVAPVISAGWQFELEEKGVEVETGEGLLFTAGLNLVYLF